MAHQQNAHGELNEAHRHVLLITGDLDVDCAVLAEDFGNCSLKLNLVMLAIQAGNNRISHGIYILMLYLLGNK